MTEETTKNTNDSAVCGSRQERVVRLLELMDQETRNHEDSAERALWHLLKQYEDYLPDVDTYFHKAFRQTDVTDCGHSDMAIWNLLHHSKLFWRIFEKIQGEKAV